MNKEKSDYWQGLWYFCCFMLCFCSFFTTPDGDTLFYKLLRLFSISPGIRLGNNSTLYIYMLIPIVLAILSAKKVLTYWWHYGLRFKNYHVLLRYLPVLMMIFVALFSMNVDRMFYAGIGQREGLQSVVLYAADHNSLHYEFTGDIRTYSYDLTFKNCGDEIVEFEVKLINDSEIGYDDLPEIFIQDDTDEARRFILPPKQTASYTGTFTVYHPTEHISGSGNYTLASVALVNETEQYCPKSLIKYPR